MASKEEVAKAAADRDERLRVEKVESLKRELATVVRTGKGDVDAITAELDHYGGGVPAGVRKATGSRTGAETRG